MNSLIAPFDTVHQTAPFSKIQHSDYLPAFAYAMEQTRAEIDAIVQNSEAPTFENTVAAMSFSGMLLERISNIFFNLHAAETNEHLEKIAQEIAPQLAALSNDITLNHGLFERIKSVYDLRAQQDLNEEQKTLLDKSYKDFVRNGALLDEEQKTELRRIDGALSVLKLKFAEHVLAETQNYSLHLTEADQLAGLPEGTIEAAAAEAADKQLPGWVFTLDYPSYIPFMTYADNRDLRREMAVAAGKKAFQDNEYNNENIVVEIAQLRYQRAQLLGYATHAHFVLEERMAQTPEQVNAFLADLLIKAKPAAQQEFSRLTDFASSLDGSIDLQKWDGSYYAEKLKQATYALDDEQLKPYFSLQNVLQGAFTIAHKLYGLQFTEVDTIDTYHPDVQTFEVYDPQQQLVAIFYTDFFPRKGKRNGAWMTSFKSQYRQGSLNERPHVAIVCNFTPPTATKPALLTFNEVTTLFHEFGHALHGMLADTTYPTLSGTSVSWDFVELPSQIMENWCYEEEALSLFAHHYRSGELIPMELIHKIKDSAAFMEGMATLRQISFGMLDLAWHGQDPTSIASVKALEKSSFAQTSLYPDVDDNAMSTSFSHIFDGGYAAGYYSYKWAEVLDADAFAYFQEKGIFNKEVAEKFKKYVLSQGGTVHPMVLYTSFRGQEPTVDALLQRAGLLEN